MCLGICRVGRVFSLHGVYYLVYLFCVVALLCGRVHHNEYVNWTLRGLLSQ